MTDQQDLGVDEIIREVKGSTKLSDVLTPEKVCPRDGWAHQVVKAVGRGLKPTQLRRVFGPIKALAMRASLGKDRGGQDQAMKEILPELISLTPVLAYSVGRGHLPRELFELLSACLDIEKLKCLEDVEKLGDFLTAIVAWHKYEYPRG
ncbi:MAG: type III-A CRISPR-associated protein Csm2 [Armatimonadetes bacterium]|nr:type III-A CRISPR-associated protein Csm2 [Armatimonadota bacterium]